MLNNYMTLQAFPAVTSKPRSAVSGVVYSHSADHHCDFSLPLWQQGKL